MAKVDLFPDFRELFKSLNAARVKYLLLGGYAVVYYGYARTTSDLDLWIAVDAENAEKISQVMQAWGGYPARDVPVSMFLEVGRMIQFGRRPTQVDILTRPTGINFDACYARRNVVIWDGIRVPLISFEDLKANKAASGRPKDRADIENLPRSS